MNVFWLVLTALLLVCEGSSVARASLGDTEQSVESDRQKTSAVVRVATHSLYKTHTLTTSANTVKEYVTPEGRVFAVTWTGISEPDLSQVFGMYYTEYQNVSAANPRRRGRAPQSMQSSNIVVEQGGHMGAVQGRAWIPSYLPIGVTPNEIQ